MGVDCRGNDFGDAKLAASAAACQERCQETSNCTFWSWVSDGAHEQVGYGRACFLKTGRDEDLIKHPHHPVVSGPKHCGAS